MFGGASVEGVQFGRRVDSRIRKRRRMGRMGAAAGLFLGCLSFSFLAGTARGQTVRVGALPSRPNIVVDAYPGERLTAIDFTEPAGASATLSHAWFSWSSTPCPLAAKIRFFRFGPPPPVGPTPWRSFAERGPFDITSPVQYVLLTPPVEVQRGDLVGIVRLTSCGNPMGQTTEAEIFAAFKGDLDSITLEASPPATEYSGSLAILAANVFLPSPSVAAVLPVVGSAPGANGSFFRTSVQLHNPGSTLTTGRIVVHPSGKSGSESDPSLRYSLGAGQAVFIADLLPAIGMSGLGSADLEVETGVVPVTVVRVFNDAGPGGTTGFTESLLAPEEALSPEQFGYLILPPDSAAFRFNIGVRTFDVAVSILANLYDSTGRLLRQGATLIPPNFHMQENVADFFGQSSLPENGRVLISLFGSGNRAIVYGATVDNRTNDPSFQLARPFP